MEESGEVQSLYRETFKDRRGSFNKMDLLNVSSDTNRYEKTPPHAQTRTVYDFSFHQVAEGMGTGMRRLPFELYLDEFQISEPCSAPSH